MARMLVEDYDGRVPSAMKDLVRLPGVGRKTANVVRSVALGQPGLPVDTHVIRLSNLLGLTTDAMPHVLVWVFARTRRVRSRAAESRERQPDAGSRIRATGGWRRRRTGRR